MFRWRPITFSRAPALFWGCPVVKMERGLSVSMSGTSLIGIGRPSWLELVRLSSHIGGLIRIRGRTQPSEHVWLQAMMDLHTLRPQCLDLFLGQVIAMEGHWTGQGITKQCYKNVVSPGQGQIIPVVDDRLKL